MPKAQAQEQRTERELNADINQAIAGTEDEIFSEAMGDDPLDGEGDKSLEEMGEGLEGDQLDEDEEADEDDADPDEVDDEADETEAEAEAEAEGDEGEPQQERQPEARQDRRGLVPSNRLREESEARRAAEERAAALDREMAEMRGQLVQLSQRVNAPPRTEPKPQERPPKPDLFADPEGYERWVLEEAERKADAKIQQRFADLQERQQAQHEEFVNVSLAQAASGDRSFEFQAAYGSLTSLDPRNAQHRAIVRSIVQAPDPGKALFSWWDENGAEGYREQIAEQLGLVPAPQEERQSQRGDNRNSRQPSQQVLQRNEPRHVTRIPPSLNAARGGQRQEITDPEMLDGSEDAVFRFATK